jgi:hypothetical protein
MADLPRIKVIDPPNAAASYDAQEGASLTTAEGTSHHLLGRSNTVRNKEAHMLTLAPIAPLSSKKLAAKLRSPTSPSALSNDTTNRGSAEGRRPSEAAIDPLSQVCAHRGSSPAGSRTRLTQGSKSSSGRTLRRAYTSCDRKMPTPRQARPRHRPTKRARTRSRAGRLHATGAGPTRQTRSEQPLPDDGHCPGARGTMRIRRSRIRSPHFRVYALCMRLARSGVLLRQPEAEHYRP